jgi:hypothetical protein
MDKIQAADSLITGNGLGEWYKVVDIEFVGSTE